MRRVVLANMADGASAISTDAATLGIYRLSGNGSIGRIKVGESDTQSVQVGPVGSGDLELAELFGSANYAFRIGDDTSGDADVWNGSVEPGGFKARIATFGPNFHAPMHASPTFDIDIVISGEIEVSAQNGDVATLRAGDSVLIPGVHHGWRVGPEGCSMAILMFGDA